MTEKIKKLDYEEWAKEINKNKDKINDLSALIKDFCYTHKVNYYYDFNKTLYHAHDIVTYDEYMELAIMVDEVKKYRAMNAAYIKLESIAYEREGYIC